MQKENLQNPMTVKKVSMSDSLSDSFMETFSKSFPRHVHVEEHHTQRTLNSISLLIEHIRSFYGHARSLKSIKKIHKCINGLLSLEHCDRKDICDALCDAELTLLSECMTHMTGLNGIEVALQLKHSSFPKVCEQADLLMDTCTSRKVISNGTV